MPDYPFAVFRELRALRDQVALWRSGGLTVGFVPTMGALHEGHLSLVDLAAHHADKVVVSIFVNPAQFAPHEDFDDYPRTEDADMEKLSLRPVDGVYLPNRDAMYPPNFSTDVTVGGVSEGLESATRPHFFGGVATVVTKLLNQVQPDIAVFGEKDYQQLLVIRRLVRDLDMPIEIIGGPTGREADGLAMSSRNAYLTTPQRETAGELNKIMRHAIEAIEGGEDAALAVEKAKTALLAAGFNAVQYLDLRDAETLEPLKPNTKSARLLAAVGIGELRLIDNMAVSLP